MRQPQTELAFTRQAVFTINRRHNIQHNDTQHNDMQHNETQHNDTQLDETA